MLCRENEIRVLSSLWEQISSHYDQTLELISEDMCLDGVVLRSLYAPVCYFVLEM